jgi:hypothetical protein
LSSNNNRMATSVSPLPAVALVTKCHYRSCGVVGPNNPRIDCYAPGCDRAFHSYCYDLGVLRKNVLGHFDLRNLQAPFLKIACKKDCYRKAYRHHANVTADPEDRNIPWNRDGAKGDDDPNNSENILIAWLKTPGNYAKFRSPPSGKTKLAVCEEICRKILRAKTLKIRKAPSVQSKIQAFEGAFRDAHDWVNNTGVGVLERDGQVTFEEAVTKRFNYYYDLVDVMSERSSARPRASTDTMNMAEDGDASSSSSSSPSDDEDDDDDEAIVIAPRVEVAPDSSSNDDEDCFVSPGSPSPPSPSPPSPSPPSPSPIRGTIGTTTVMGTAGTSVSTLTSETETEAGAAVAKKRKATSKKAKSKSKKAKRTKTRMGDSNKSSRGSSAVNPHEIDGDDDSWQVSMLSIKRGEVNLEQEKWDSQKRQHTLEIELQQEKWKTAKQQQTLEYKFDLMVKYKKLKAEGFDNHQIVKMIPDMRPIIDSANMPAHLQLSPEEQPTQQEEDR